MPNNFTSQLTDTFDNPFDDINANIIEPQKILSLWCTPFNTGVLKDMDEKKFRTQKLPIILQGSRGSGKTTILKYFSYPVLKERANERNGQSLLSVIKSERSIGFYFRCDDSFVNTFKSIFENQSPDKWLSFFEHYLELSFCKQIISVLMDLNEVQNICIKSFEYKFIQNIIKEVNIAPISSATTIQDIFNFILTELRYIDTYKNESIFSNVIFTPSALLKLYSLSDVLINNISIFVAELNKTIYLILIDEFENLTEELQQFFNTAIKFSKQSISLRIGRRSEGIVTKATINQTEYLREKHDYFLVEINKGQKFEDQKKYFTEIAFKRLCISSKLCHSDGILGLLGDKEDLDEECREICRGRQEHLKQILSEKNSISSNAELKDQIINIIKNPNNPIAETINALWVIRSKDDVLISAQNAKEAMLAFFNKTAHPNVKKYINDYENKYRYSITVLLSSIYKRKKLYYGFNTIAHLADGNPRTFINICRTIISDALFYEKNRFFETKSISKESQNRAISEFSMSEFENVCSIIKYGNKIRNLILNVGNVFAEFHKDKKVRYPETNQFVFNKLELSDDLRNIINTSESWSMIIKREKTQRVSASIDRKGDIYYINRAFSPIFNISYRIRGGVNVRFSSDEITRMMVSLSTERKLSQQDKLESSTKNDIQLSLFNQEDRPNE
ncbi:MAG: hypothetical protein A2Y15_08775 [Clostridiales bacterium GWF2_36_10]|nr:MAG: hypothetical protein A2Y15_08775 [Clostridiales bacterium GWF2_36_10]HAN20437.1 hypothetical protein [Clostridiales bacterium]